MMGKGNAHRDNEFGDTNRGGNLGKLLLSDCETGGIGILAIQVSEELHLLNPNFRGLADLLRLVWGFC